MVTLKRLPWHSDSWTALLASAVTDLGTLLARLGLEREQLALDHAPAFPLRVPQPFLERMRHGDPDDPLLRQVLPLLREREEVDGFTVDPLAEKTASLATGVIQKYAGRALLIAAPSCAVHCRYCFRRHFPYAEHHGGQRFPGLERIAEDLSLREVILSGGDPLLLKDDRLAELCARLEAIPQLTRLRIHTRLPVVIPQRVTGELLALLRRSRLQAVLVVHVNHPREIDARLERALRTLRDEGITTLNQSVLLRGVNDDADSLIELSERLFRAGTLPYYLHLPDAVAGTAHFHVSDNEGRALLAELAARLPGYLVPRLAREIPGADAKQVFSNL